jgi:hypothetical protein
MDKAAEKKVLQGLKKVSYFSDSFSEVDIDIMCANIDKDFPLLLGTEVGDILELKQAGDKEIAVLKSEIEALYAQVQAAQKEVKSLEQGREKILENLLVNPEWETGFDASFSAREIITKKLQLGYELSKKEATAVLEMIA